MLKYQPGKHRRNKMKMQQYKIVVYIAIFSLVTAMLIQQPQAMLIYSEGRLHTIHTLEEEFRTEVEKLKNMGFNNGEGNMKLIHLVYSLVSNDGNVEKALKHLHL